MVVSSYSGIVDILSQKVYDAFISEPVDVVENDYSTLYECSVWRLIKPRNSYGVKIGSANYIIAKNLVIKYLSELKDSNPLETGKILFESILINLESKKLIVRSPEDKRKGFKIISNDRKS